MPLTDQQLRQELLGYGETVPPITQRNREQLRARLEVLRSQPRSRAAANSPSRTRNGAAASPSRGVSTGSPSSSRLPSSPSRSRTRPAASPSRMLPPSSPSRTRGAAATTNTSTTRASTRSKAVAKLIELSDSDTDLTSNDLISRGDGTSQTGPNVQTRSIAMRKQVDVANSSASAGVPLVMTDDVEQSIARHRREIKQLLDSARDRTRATSASLSASSQSSRQQQNDASPPPILSGSPTSSNKDRSRQHSKSDDNYERKSPKSADKQSKTSSPIDLIGKPIEAFGKKYLDTIKNILKVLLIASILLGGLAIALQKGTNFFSRRQDISCSIDNATTCADMTRVIAAVRKQLQVRTGEVECGFRDNTTLLVTREEIERNLDKQGLVFRKGDDIRWQTLKTYILTKPVKDILLWNDNNQETRNIIEATKLSTKDALHSLVCPARYAVDTKTKNYGLIVLGSTALLSLVWLLRRCFKDHNNDDETTFKTYLDKAVRLLEDQYEKHVHDPQTQPWLSISHIRDKLIPTADQQRLKNIWERVKNHISEQETRVQSASQMIQGVESDVWQWIKSKTSSPKKNQSESPKKIDDETYIYSPTDVGLTECLKLRNFFSQENCPTDDEIDQVVDDIQNRCAKIKQVEHIGIHSIFVYLKFSSKEAAAQGYHQLNNWKYQGREINAKYIRLNRYYEHFPEAQETNSKN